MSVQQQKLRVSYARVLIEVDVTMDLKNQITIRDPQGAKMTQHVEYDWRLPFCSICNKFGHECKRNEELPKRTQEKKQTWTTKEENKGTATTIEYAESNKNKKNENENTKEGESEEENWTQVKSLSKNRGKYLMFKTNRFDCTNGFEALRVRECSKGFDNKVP